jgi:purine-binding chemotaxis protein CheW
MAEGRKKIDGWDEVRRRLEETRIAAERDFAPTREESRRILRQRAVELAREPEHTGEQFRLIEVVEFVLAYEHYAIESSFVREILPLRNFTVLPGAPPFVFGIMNVRGQIISIVDFKRFFELPGKGLADLNKVIILEGENLEFGVLADSIIGTGSLDENELQPPLPTLTGIREKYLKGLTRQGTVVLSAAAILADKNIIVDEQVK